MSRPAGRSESLWSRRSVLRGATDREGPEELQIEERGGCGVSHELVAVVQRVLERLSCRLVADRAERRRGLVADDGLGVVLYRLLQGWDARGETHLAQREGRLVLDQRVRVVHHDVREGRNGCQI